MALGFLKNKSFWSHALAVVAGVLSHAAAASQTIQEIVKALSGK